jgi:sulfur carrier protein
MTECYRWSNTVSMRVTVNGKEHVVAASATVAALLGTLALRSDGIAVALNDDVVPRAEHATRTLNDGDRLEIIVAVAGG